MTVGLETLKVIEITMLNRNESWYYHDKTKDYKLYNDITHKMSRFISRTRLLQLNHSYSTQRNEDMNTSVAALARIGKNYFTTESSRTRVGIAGACQIMRLVVFWTLICRALGFEIDEGLLSVLKQRDKHKEK